MTTHLSPGGGMREMQKSQPGRRDFLGWGETEGGSQKTRRNEKYKNGLRNVQTRNIILSISKKRKKRDVGVCVLTFDMFTQNDGKHLTNEIHLGHSQKHTSTVGWEL